ncbi:MAG TPA: hypothetical protein PKC72_02985 [Chitinophagaceae bacterium]|nr:hypothetical protein [Chitinophagaceae bacterium]
MKKLSYLLFILFVGFISCKGKDSTGIQENATENTYSEDSAEIRNTIVDFYTWYTKNYEKFMQYDLYSGIKKEDEPPYKINWDEVKKYQDFIRNNVPQLGEEFLANQQVLFKRCDSAFKVDVEDDIPYYFDFDWYTNTQEDPQYMLDEIKKSKLWNISVDGDNAKVNIKGYDNNGEQPAITVIDLELKKQNNTWKIAKIGSE